MDLTRSTAAAAKPAQTTPPPESSVRSDLRKDVRSDAQNNVQSNVQSNAHSNVRNDLRNAVRHDAKGQQPSGFGLPCSNCRLYYPANLDVCPACNSRARVLPGAVPPIPKVQVAAESSPDIAVVEQEREAFLKELESRSLRNPRGGRQLNCYLQPGKSPRSRRRPCLDLQIVLRAPAATCRCIRSRAAHGSERSGADYLRRGLGRSLRSQQDLHQRCQRPAQRIAQTLRSFQRARPLPSAGQLNFLRAVPSGSDVGTDSTPVSRSPIFFPRIACIRRRPQSFSTAPAASNLHRSGRAH